MTEPTPPRLLDAGQDPELERALVDQAVADAELDAAEREGGAHTRKPSQTGDVEHFTGG